MSTRVATTNIIASISRPKAITRPVGNADPLPTREPYRMPRGPASRCTAQHQLWTRMTFDILCPFRAPDTLSAFPGGVRYRVALPKSECRYVSCVEPGVSGRGE